MRSELFQIFPFGRGENGKDDVDFFKCKFFLMNCQKLQRTCVLFVNYLCNCHFVFRAAFFSLQNIQVFALHTRHV